MNLKTITQRNQARKYLTNPFKCSDVYTMMSLTLIDVSMFEDSCKMSLMVFSLKCTELTSNKFKICNS